MTLAGPAPPASASPEAHADWLELSAIASSDRNSATQDLIQAVRSAGTTDVFGEDSDEQAVDKGAEVSEPLADDAFAELEDRYKACGGAYPFLLGEQYVQASEDFADTPYAFLLLLSRFGRLAAANGPNAAELFEDLCCYAAESYMGGTDKGARSYMFGFPRRVEPAGFQAALDRLCGELGEGGGSKDRPRRRDQQDAKLDLVAWRPFADGRSGKVIGFGQCSTGNNWRDKLTELQPRNFCGLWMHELPPVEPTRFFFVPHRVEYSQWLEASFGGGVLFDRCRIAHHTFGMTGELRDRCAAWSQEVLTTEAATP